jgi:hypothetical protein
MTPAEVIDLLTLAAAYDRRTVGQSDVEAWGAMATKCGWTAAHASRAVLVHFERSDRPVMPAHINAIIDEATRGVRSRFTACITPPRELADDPRAEIAWRRQYAAEYIDRALDAWSAGQQIPEPVKPDELAAGVPDEVRRLVGSTFALPRDVRQPLPRQEPA